MAIHIALQNPRTGELKQIKVGWNWILFFFSSLLGIPLFTRKLIAWGCVFLALNVAALTFKMIGDKTVVFGILVFLTQVILAFYVGAKGNQMTARALIDRGWRFIEPKSEMTRFAKMKWKIFDAPGADPDGPNPTSLPAEEP